jgi:hypothetical protein
MKREPSAWGYNSATMFLGDINTGTWPSRLGESSIWDSKNVVMSPAGLGPENDCAGEDQKQLQMADPSSRHRGCYIRTITASVQLENKITGWVSQGACCQDKPTDSKPPVVKLTLSLSEASRRMRLRMGQVLSSQGRRVRLNTDREPL